MKPFQVLCNKEKGGGQIAPSTASLTVGQTINGSLLYASGARRAAIAPRLFFAPARAAQAGTLSPSTRRASLLSTRADPGAYRRDRILTFRRHLETRTASRHSHLRSTLRFPGTEACLCRHAQARTSDSTRSRLPERQASTSFPAPGEAFAGTYPETARAGAYPVETAR